MGMSVRTAFAAVSLFAAANVGAVTLTPYGQTPAEQEALQWIWQKAQHFSGLKSSHGDGGYARIPVYKVSEADMSQIICPQDPQNCRGLGAVYDTTRSRILMRSDLDPAKDSVSASFLLHEDVHALQHERRSEDEMYGTCERLFTTEREAYQAQDRFLASEGAFFRAGGFLRFFVCKNPVSPA